MNICICDDEKNIHEIIENKIINSNLCLTQNCIKNFFSAEELLQEYSNGIRFDIIFLDIEMNKLTGLEVAEKIRKISTDVIIVFISNYPKYVFDSFKVEPLHFIVKPITDIEFQNVFQRALSKYKNLHTSITLRWQSERYVIKIDSIKYVEGYKRHITVCTTDGEFEALGKIPDMFEILEPHGFIQTHQGFIVNMDYIKRFDRSDVILLDDSKVMISVRKRTEALRAFDNYLKNRKW